MPRVKSTRGNLAKFQKELAAQARFVAEKMMPDTIVDIALELRQQAEDNTRAMLGHAPPDPPIGADNWHAGPTVTYGAGKGSDAESRAALAGFKLGQKVVVWNPIFYLYFHEKGTVNLPPKGFFRAAIEAVANRPRELRA